jgi:DMSO/TMAO reductase YedYZ molybdopterin-dependent catalytic subunit
MIKNYAWVNLALLILLLPLLLTGFWGLLISAEGFSWVMWLHGIGGYSVTVLLVWKGWVIWNAFRQQRRSLRSPASLIFLAMVLQLVTILGTGLLWSYFGPRYLFGFSLINLHGVLAVGLTALLAWHTLVRRFVFRIPGASDRRAFLRFAGIGVVGLALWQGANPIKMAAGLPGAMRRFTGSYETGSFSGIFPETGWLFDRPRAVSLANWRLVIVGEVAHPMSLTYDQLAQLAADTTTELLDCTGGWYTTQEWAGVSLSRLLNLAGLEARACSVTIEAVSGYRRRFPLTEADSYLLATHVAGMPLSHGHGYPLRLVAPSRRGFDWVKWVTRIEVNETSALQQSPLPLQ